MITKIISAIMSVIMMIMTSIFPGFVWPGTETMENGEFLAQVDAAFGYVADDSKEPVLGLEPGDEYYDAVATAAKYDVLVDYDAIDVFTSADTEFVATVLVNAAGLKALNVVKIANADEFTNIEKVTIAVENGLIPISKDGKVSTAPMSVQDITAAITTALGLRHAYEEVKDEIDFADDVKKVDNYELVDNTVVLDGAEDIAVGDVFVLEQSDELLTGAALKAEAVEVVDGKKVVTGSDVALEEVVDKIDYAGASDVDFATAMIEDGNGAVISDGYLNAEAISKEDVMKTLKKLANVSFSVKGFKIKAKVTDTGVDFSVAKGVCDGVTLSKAYSLTNLTVDAKADMNIKKLNFNEAYLKFDYDLVDTTTISGSYGKVFGDPVTSEGEKLTADTKIANAVNKYILSSFDSTSIKLFTFTVPLGTTPLTVKFDITLNIDVNGRMSIVVTSEELHGIEIVNNKVSKISESKVIDRQVDIYGDFSICLGLYVALGLYGYSLIDVGVLGGLGAFVEATAKLVDENGNVVVDSTYAVPVDYLVELAAGLDFEGEIDIAGHADIYGILKIALGENSVLSKVGLSKTWTIYDKSNGVFASIDF